MADKQILAALQIESNEVRLTVGEIYNTRLNVLKKECVPCKGMDGIRIVEPKAVATAIREAASNVEKVLGVEIQSVLLAIPAYRFKKESRTFSKVIETSDRRITPDDIKDIYQRALSVNIGSDLEIINVTSSVYKINGITYRKIPIGEQCDVLEAEVDLLCCDKMTAYDYASVVEMAGLKIVDVCLDNYAVCKEAALFEQTMRNFILLIEFEKQHSLFSLIYDGKIITSENDNTGYEVLAKPIEEKYGLPEKYSLGLLMKYGQLNITEFTDRPIYSWTVNKVTKTITDRELYETIQESFNKLTADFASLCEPILQRDNVSVLVSGAGAELNGLDSRWSEAFNKQVSCYFPETLGARDAKWAVNLGLFYAYIDQQVIHQDFQSSIDVNQFQRNMNIRNNGEEKVEGLTARFKNILFPGQRN